MRRRDFFRGIASLAIASPFSARAQRASKQVPRLGALIGFAEHDPATERLVAAFMTSLADLSWVVDRNIAIEFRYGAGNAEKNQVLAKELVSLEPDVIFVNSTSATAAVLRETSTIPVVFATVSDPVGSGFVASLARPGGNVICTCIVDKPLTGIKRGESSLRRVREKYGQQPPLLIAQSIRIFSLNHGDFGLLYQVSLIRTCAPIGAVRWT